MAMDEVKPASDDFWRQTQVRGPDDCWEFTGRRSSKGYGRFSIRGKEYRAHRLSFLMEYGYSPPVVMHVCDNRSCVNPRHLRAGTVRANNRDMVRKDRQARGGDFPQAKLTREMVRQIRYLHETGQRSQTQLAAVFGVSRPTIHHIVNRNKWRHVA